MPLSYDHFRGFNLAWSDASLPSGHEVAHYQLVVSPNSDLSSPVFDSGIFTTGYNLTGGLNHGTTYYYKVTAVNGAGATDWNDGITSGTVLYPIAYIGTPNGTPKIGDSGHPYGTLQSGYDASVASGINDVNLVFVSEPPSSFTLNTAKNTSVSAALPDLVNSKSLTLNVTATLLQFSFGPNISGLNFTVTGYALSLVDSDSTYINNFLIPTVASTPLEISNFSGINSLTIIPMNGAIGVAGSEGTTANGSDGGNGVDGEFPSSGVDGSPGAIAQDGGSPGDGYPGESLSPLTINTSYVESLYMEAGVGGVGGAGGNGGSANGGAGGNGGNATGPTPYPGGAGAQGMPGGEGGDATTGGNGGDGGDGNVLTLNDTIVNHLWRRPAAGGSVGAEGIPGSANGGASGDGGAGYGGEPDGFSPPEDGAPGTPGSVIGDTPVNGDDGTSSTYVLNGSSAVNNDHTI